MTGTDQFDCAVIKGMPAIFEFFGTRKDRDNRFEKYKDLLLPRDDRDPTTAVITIQDEVVDDSYASFADQLDQDDEEDAAEEVDMGGAKIVGEDVREL